MAYEDFQYNSCVSRGICSINPQTSALQTVMVIYIKYFAIFSKSVNISDDIKEIILNIIATTIYNLEYNESTFLNSLKIFKKILPNMMECTFEDCFVDNIEEVKNKVNECFNETSDIISAIKYGEKIFNNVQENISPERRDLYNILLVVAKSLSINLLELISYQKDNSEAFNVILGLFNAISSNKSEIDNLKLRISEAAKVDIGLMKELRDVQEERYGIQRPVEVSYTTSPNKAVLVAGASIKELENILEALKEENIDIYTHDEMMLAHTFPKFSEYKHLKGQYGYGLQNCLLDYATFPGPVILTKHSLHNVENLYRGNLFTTDYLSSPKGIVKIENNDFTKVIQVAMLSKGFKRGKVCEDLLIGYSYECFLKLLTEKVNSNNFDKIFLIGLNEYSLEQKKYFEKLVKLTPKNVLIISFLNYLDAENLIYLNTCFDYFSLIRIYESITSFGLQTTVFIPNCHRSTISQMIYISEFENTKIYLDKCTPIILKPSLITTLQQAFNISIISSVKNDLEKIL